MIKLRYIPDLIKLGISKVIAPILKLTSKKYRDIWIIGERKNEAKDNGYHLFKYIRENHPNVEAYYVIDKNSKDIDKIKGMGNLIYHDSIKHYIYYVMASKLVCAHLSSCVPDSPVCWKFHDNEMKYKKKAFIQHGIIKETIESLMHKNTQCNLFICGAKPEYEFVRSMFGYPKGYVKYTGLARFDNLHDRNEKNQILVMPTWRQWIPGSTWSIDNKEEAKKIFLESEYYSRFNELINNENVINILEKYSMNMIFYPHYEMQGYIDLFKAKSDKVIIAKKENYDVQQLLKESKILITDYSSIAFDFGYMKKPVIYYQFDEDKYYQNHYQKGYYDYDKHGFGPIVDNISELETCLENILTKNQGYSYIYRCKAFFEKYDMNNSQRVFNAISEM